MNLPEAFKEKLKALLEDDYEAYLAGFDKEYEQTFRVNQLKAKPADLSRRFVFREVPWCGSGCYVDADDRVSLDPYYAAGLYYIQEPSAMAPAQFLPVKPGDRVLDLCAAPGGKSVALAGKLQGQGILVSNDISASRCKALLKNMEMAGAKNIMITCETPEHLKEQLPEYFDAILVDAPCSGEGMFRKDPAMVKAWSPEEVLRYQEIQSGIIRAAASMLRPGGYLMYSTCTYSPEENEQVVEQLLTEGFTLCQLPLTDGMAKGNPAWSVTGNPQLVCCRRFWNHRVDGEGQFAALLKKEGSDGVDSDGNWPDSISQKLPQELIDFMKEIPWELPSSRIHFQKERIFLLPETNLPAAKLRFIRTGLYLGDMKKNRFEPSQALAMALTKEEYPNILNLSVDDERVNRYLRCETIHEESAKDGWVLILVDGYPLGWGKAQKGMIKNKYAPGWRRQ